MQPPSPQVSVVIPVYNNKEYLETLVKEIDKTLSKAKKKYEIIFVDDRSPDKSWDVLAELAKENSNVFAFRLNRNHGQHIALAAGIRESRGEWVITMDGDMQDHPRAISRLLEKAEEGYDIVLSSYKSPEQTLIRKISNYLFALLIYIISGDKIRYNTGSLTLFSRKVADAYNSVNERYRHHLQVLYWLKFRTGYIVYTKYKRTSGNSSYNFSALVVHAFNAIFFHQNRLLYFIAILGMAVTVFSLVFGVYVIYMYLFYTPPSGWTSLSLLISTLGGITIFSLGVVGIYLGKIFEQTKNRPLYAVDKRAGERVKQPSEKP